jgi:hypothetical protein
VNRYEYMHPMTGRVVEREFRIGTAPASIRIDGQRFNRIPSRPALPSMLDHVNGRDVSFAAYSLDPRHHKYQIPVFRSQQEIRAFERRANDDGVPLRYGISKRRKPVKP